MNGVFNEYEVFALQMRQFWSLHNSVLSGELWEITIQIRMWGVWAAVRVVLHIELRVMRETGILGTFCRARRLALLWVRPEWRGGRLVIPAQLDITQARQSGAAWGGGGGRRWRGGGGGPAGAEALSSLVLLLLHPPVLEPDLDLPLLEVEQTGHLRPPRPAQVAAEVELLLQLHKLRAGVRRARPFRDCAYGRTLLGVFWGESRKNCCNCRWGRRLRLLFSNSLTVFFIWFLFAFCSMKRGYWCYFDHIR